LRIGFDTTASDATDADNANIAVVIEL